MRVSDLKRTTDTIKPDEKCQGVLEVDMFTADYKATHRYRLTYVVRGDAPAAYVQDLTELGLYSHLQNHPPVSFPVYFEHTVGEAWNILDSMHGREDTRKFIAELKEASATDRNIIKEAITRAEQIRKFKDRNIRTVAAIERELRSG